MNTDQFSNHVILIPPAREKNPSASVRFVKSVVNLRLLFSVLRPLPSVL